jgi:hypothetical protein
MRASTAAALVGAGIISTLVFPLIGLRLRAGRAAADLEDNLDDDDLAPRPSDRPVLTPTAGLWPR